MLSRSFLFFVWLFSSFSNASAQWVELENLPSRGIEASYKMGDVLWVGTSNGLYFSVDTGKTFRIEDDLPRGVNVTSIQELSGELLVFCNQFIQERNRLVLCKTADNGETWKVIDTGLPPCLWARYFVIGGKIYIPSCTGPNLTEFYRSDDKGETFQFINMHYQFKWMVGLDSVLLGLTYYTISVSRDYGQTFDKIYSLNNTDNSIRQVIQSDSTVLISTWFGELLKSNNWGATWDTVQFQIGNNLIFWQDPDDTLLFASRGKYIFKSNDFGETWDTLGSHFPNDITALYKIGDSQIAHAGSWIFTQMPDGSWKQGIQGIFNSNIWGICNSNNMLLAAINGKVSLSKDMARSWKAIPIPSASSFIFGLSVIENRIYLSNSKGIYISYDEGNNWKQIYFEKIDRLITVNDDIYFTNGLSLYQVKNEAIYLISDKLPNYLRGFGRSESGYWLLTGGYMLYFLPKNGVSWEYKSKVINAQVIGHIDIVTFEGRIFIPAYGSVYYSDDDGMTWKEASMPLPNFYLTNPGMIVIHENDLYLAAQSTYTGVMVSHDKGETWSFFNENLGNTHIKNLVVADNILLADARNSGLWVRPLKGSFVSGKVFSDENSNHIFDRHEKPVANIPVVAQPSNKATRTDANGFYHLDVPLGETLSVVTTSVYDEVEPDWAVASNGAFQQDFAIQPKDIIHDASVFIGLTNEINKLTSVKFKLAATNSGTMPVTNAQLVLHLPRSWKFYKANLAPASVETDSVRWVLNDLSVGASVMIQIEAVAIQIVPGQAEKIYARINIDHADAYPLNNSFVRECTPGNPILPLSKEVFPMPYLHPDYLALNHRLDYSIIFDYPEASGMPFTISDTLSPYLDLQTFALIYSDVPCTWEILDNRIVRFTFTPDGISKQQRVVRFSIMPRAGLPIGTLIENTAYLEHPKIPARLSNPSVVAIGYPLPEWNPSRKPNQLQCYPNPATDFSIIVWAEPLQEDGVLEVFNTMGQLLVSHQIRYGFSQFQIPLEAFPTGQYSFRLITEKEKYVGKLIVK
ncbi:MAG: T9SS type A sorting domain-containing protein [Saprospiraceae bacterium]|nr:T9SS type A sorting domain-containing protein [Saprospiraceae bacterium]